MIYKSSYILLADDNQDDVMLMLTALKKANIMNDVVVTRDGAAALDYLFGLNEYECRDLNKMPQLIILDIDMPKVNGLQVLQMIRENERAKLLPVIIHSGSNDDTVVCESHERGANDFCQKCIGFDNLVKTVRQWV
jgi:two-component system response regulator